MNNTEYSYYCDESCHLLNDKKQFMVLGYISILNNRIKKFKQEIKDLRERHNNGFEIKWTKLNSWNYPFYSELVDLFFDRTEICFRTIIVDKHKYIAEKAGNDYDRFYYLMYYQLIYHKLDVYSTYNIYLDKKDDLSSHRAKDLHRILNVNMGTINKVQHVNSHEVEFIQLCDLLIGAISYKLNHPKGSSNAKLKLIEKIEKRINASVTEQTGKSEEKFNIFKINI